MAGSDAQAGFLYQNLVAALHLLDMIEIHSTIQAITLENPDRAPHVDDIIIESAGETRFVQVKWAKEAGATYTLNALITAEDNGTSLWSKLATGFKKIRHETGTKTVELFSTRAPGKNRQPAQGFDTSLDVFIAELHEPWLACDPSVPLSGFSAYPTFSATLDKLKEASGLDNDAEFEAFLRALRFRLGQDDIERIENRLAAKLLQLGIEKRQIDTLHSSCVRWSISGIKLTAKEILTALGLNDRFARRLRHRFPVDDALWVPTESLFNRLDAVLAQFSSGFIVVTGEPGAGKSTALTCYLKKNDAILFGYYCFIPDERVMGNDRLQEEAFVQTLCGGLLDAFPDISFTTPFAPPSVSLLNTWLEQLSLCRQKVIFLVDGLDHVDRKTKLSGLSSPLTPVIDAIVPENVLIILSMRNVDTLPPDISVAIHREPERHIRIQRFNREQVHQFMTLRGLDAGQALLDRVYAVSAGVPIYLQYLARMLSPLPSDARYRHLENTPTIQGGEIDVFHDHQWQLWASDTDLVMILTIMAVRQEYSTPEMLYELMQDMGHRVSQLEVSEKLKSVIHVLNVSEAKGFTLNHASLTEFVRSRMSDNITPITHAILNWYKKSPLTDEAWRNRFRHLAELGRNDELLAACHDDWVTQAWEHFRPLTEIHRNLDIAWKASADTGELNSFVRISLLKQQTALIDQNTDISLLERGLALLDMGLQDSALNSVWDGDDVMVSAAEFSVFAQAWYTRLHRSLPEAILRAAFRAQGTDIGEDYLLLCRSLCLIDDPVTLLNEIAQRGGQNGEGASPCSNDAPALTPFSLQVDVLKTLAEAGDISRLFKVAEQLTAASPLWHPLNAALAAACANVDEIPDARDYAANVLPEQVPETLKYFYQTSLAIKHIDFVRESGLARPAIPRSLTLQFRFNSELVNVFAQFRHYGLNTEVWENDIFLMPGLTMQAGRVASALVDLAELWVNWGCHPDLDEKGCEEWLNLICDRLALDEDNFNRGEDEFWHAYLSSAHQLFRQVWECAQKYPQFGVLPTIAAHWLEAEEGARCRRFTEASRELAMLLVNSDGEHADLILRLLNAADDAERQDEDTQSLTLSMLKSARAWGRCGFTDIAVQRWQQTARVACGVAYRKDYQFTKIMKPLELAHQTDPQGSLARLSEQFEAIHQLEDTGASKQVACAIEALLALVAQWYPARALRGLVEEERLIFRERALGHIILRLMDTVPDQRVLLALLKTMGRKEDERTFRESTAATMTKFFTQLLQRGDIPVADEMYLFARDVYRIEQPDTEKWLEWAQRRNAYTPALDTACADETGINARKQLPPFPVLPDVRYTRDESIVQQLQQVVPGDLMSVRRCFDNLAIQAWRIRCVRELKRQCADWTRQAGEVDVAAVINAQCTAFEQLIGTMNITDRDDSPHHALVRTFIEQLKASVPGAEKYAFGDYEVVFTGSLGGLRLDSDAANHIRTYLPTWIPQIKLQERPGWIALTDVPAFKDIHVDILVGLAPRVMKSQTDLFWQVLEKTCESIKDSFYHHVQGREVIELAMRMDPERGKRLAMDCFRHQFMSYPSSLIYALDTILTLVGSAFMLDGVDVYTMWARHNQRLTDGLLPTAAYPTWLHHEADDDVESSVIRYLLTLFVYPVVDTRLSALESLTWLLSQRPDLIELIIGEWGRLTEGQKEYTATLFDALGRIYPALRDQWADCLLAEADLSTHYTLQNIIASALGGDESRHIPPHPYFAALPPLSTRLGELALPKPASAARIGWPPYYFYLLQKMTQDGVPASDVGRLASEALQAILPDLPTIMKEEQTIHQDYNINDNYDALEISGPYSEACRQAINHMMLAAAQAGIFTQTSLSHHARVMRLCDPSDMVARIHPRPHGADWLDLSQSDDDFMSFAGIEDLITGTLKPNDGFIRLFEDSEYRNSGAGFSVNFRLCSVHIELFAVKTGHGLSDAELLELSDEALVGGINSFRHELHWYRLPTHPVIIPLVASTSRQFRGRATPDLAALSGVWRDHFPDVSLTEHDLSGSAIGHQTLSRGCEWLEGYDQNRRRNEPCSTGFQLGVECGKLAELQQMLNADLMARVTICRRQGSGTRESELLCGVHTDLRKIKEW